MIDIPAGLECADAINDLPAMIEFKRYLGQAVEIAVWMRANHERNLRFGKPYFDCRFHRDTDWLLQLLVAVPPGSDLLNLAKNLFLAANDPRPVHAPNRFLVALPAVPDLFICAKHLFFAAMVSIVLAEAQGWAMTALGRTDLAWSADEPPGPTQRG